MCLVLLLSAAAPLLQNVCVASATYIYEHKSMHAHYYARERNQYRHRKTWQNAPAQQHHTCTRVRIPSIAWACFAWPYHVKRNAPTCGHNDVCMLLLHGACRLMWQGSNAASPMSQTSSYHGVNDNDDRWRLRRRTQWWCTWSSCQRIRATPRGLWKMQLLNAQIAFSPSSASP